MVLIIWRFVKKSWRVHLAMTLLLACSVTVFAMYGSYIERQNNLLGIRLNSPVQEGMYVVELPEPVAGPAEEMPYRGAKELPVMVVAGWNEERMRTNLGDVLVATLDAAGAAYFGQAAGTVSVPRGLAGRRGLVVGDVVTFIFPQGAVPLEVTGVHDHPMFVERLLVYADSFQSTGGRFFLYKNIAPEEREMNVWRYMERLYPEGEIIDYRGVQAVAREIIEANYSPGVRARMELVSFISLAFLSAMLLSFLDRRKFLAILKAMGLKARELAGIIGGEGLIAPILGALSGALMSLAVLRWLEVAEMGMSVSVRLVVVSMLSVLPAALVGVLVLARFAQQATVNQLLFERPIPMRTVRVEGLSSRWPALEPMMDQGIRFVKLDTVHGHFDGIIFRREGDYMKQGEVLAVGTEWGGVQVREYLSPATGQIVFFDHESGFCGVMPDESCDEM